MIKLIVTQKVPLKYEDLPDLPISYINHLKKLNKKEESILARKLIIKQVKIYCNKNFLPEIWNDLKPIYTDGIYWSISHRLGNIFVAVSDQPVWVDIEVCKKRKKDIFDLFDKKEFESLWDINLENFYFLRVAKESFLKLKLLDLSAIKYIKVINATRGKFNIDGVNFFLKLTIIFKGEKYYNTFVTRRGKIFLWISIG